MTFDSRANDPDAPEVLTFVLTDTEAIAVVAALKGCGIHASTTGGYTAGFRAQAPGQLQVIVRRHELQLARQVLADIKEDAAEIDWSQVDVGEPEENI
jgi:hypothetical protein